MRDFPQRVEALLVDFDGTLVDSLAALWGCYQSFLKRYDVVATEDDFMALLAPSLFEIVGKLKKQFDLPESIEVLYDEYRSLISKAYQDVVTLFPNGASVLKKRKEQGMKIALVTSAPEDLINIFLNKAELDNFFDVVVSGSLEIPTKPSSDLYRHALKVLGVSPSEALGIEDSAGGVKSASSASIYTIQFIPDNSPSIHSENADIVTNSWEGVDEIVDGYQTLGAIRKFFLGGRNFRGEIELSDVEAVEIDRLWEEAKKEQNGRLFNGLLFRFLSFADEGLIGNFVEYRLFMAQLKDSKWKDRLEIYPVAISGVCRCGVKYLIGRRSPFVTDYPNCYELVPSGGIEPSSEVNGKIDVVMQTLKELEEEAGVPGSFVKLCVPQFLVKDLRKEMYEICVNIEIDKGKLVGGLSSSEEYSTLTWVTPMQLKSLLSSSRKEFVPLTAFLIEKL